MNRLNPIRPPKTTKRHFLTPHCPRRPLAEWEKHAGAMLIFTPPACSRTVLIRGPQQAIWIPARCGSPVSRIVGRGARPVVPKGPARRSPIGLILRLRGPRRRESTRAHTNAILDPILRSTGPVRRPRAFRPGRRRNPSRQAGLRVGHRIPDDRRSSALRQMARYDQIQASRFSLTLLAPAGVCQRLAA